MRIVMPDSRVIDGTPLQSIGLMRSLVFVPTRSSIADYLRTTDDQALTVMGVEFVVEDGSDDKRDFTIPNLPQQCGRQLDGI
jgi:hypothetical protein